MRFADAAGALAGQIGAVLGWRPDAFWRATPAEVAAVLRALAGPEGEPASAEDLQRLQGMFPDNSVVGGLPLHQPAAGPPPHAAHGEEK